MSDSDKQTVPKEIVTSPSLDPNSSAASSLPTLQPDSSRRSSYLPSDSVALNIPSKRKFGSKSSPSSAFLIANDGIFDHSQRRSSYRGSRSE